MNENTKASLPEDMVISRAQTQKNVNRTTLTSIINRFPKHNNIKVLDLPCGNMEFLEYVKELFPYSELYGGDIAAPQKLPAGVHFVQMDLTREFPLPADQSFDLITSISGVMMFSNTQGFVENCCLRLKSSGTIIITNDNSSTIIDRIAFLLFGRYRMFKQVFADNEALTENVPVQELCRLLRKNNIDVEEIIYTSFYWKDLVFLPLALVVYPFQWFSLKRLKTGLPENLQKKMFPFKHFFCKHYVMAGRKN